MPRVLVLLSTYNGARFLREQLDSIARQRDVDVHVLARDDGSSDDTVAILRAANHVTLVEGAHLGAAKSFFELLAAADSAEYFAFSDQDDVWDDDKLHVAVERLRGIDSPALYCSSLRYIDAGGRPRGRSKPARIVSFENALFENMATGCTVVLNRAARELALRCIPERVVMHDAWLYLLVSAFGKVVFDPEPHVSYRQHAGNVIGATAHPLGHYVHHFRRLVAGGGFGFVEQAESFLRCHGDHQGLVAKLAATRTSVGARLRYALGGRVVRQSALHALLVRVLIAGGWF